MDNTDSKLVRPGDPRVPCFAILGYFTSELELVNLEGGSSSSVKITVDVDRSLGIVTINGEVFAVTLEDILKIRSDGTTEHNISLPARLDVWSRIVLFQKKIYIIQPRGELRRERMLCFDPADNSLTDDLPGCGLNLGFCASATDEFICAMGGRGTWTRSMKFDPLTRTWEKASPMRKKRSYAAAATLDGKIYVMGGQWHPTSVEYYNPGNNSWTEISDMNAERDEFSACVDDGRLYAVGGDGELKNGFHQHSIEVYDKNKWMVATKFQTKVKWTRSCFWPHGSHQPGDPIPEIKHFIEKLELSVAKEERLKLFHEILEYEPWQQRDIAKTIGSIDFNGVALQSPDVSAIGSIINHSAHLDSVNLKACKLLPGSLQILRNRVMQTVKVDKLRVDVNPDLTVDDLIAGVDLCARVGARYVYDLDHLSASDRQKFTSHSRKYQPKDESAEKKMSKTRKSLIREQRFQKMYKKPSGNERERIRHVLDFSSKFEEQPEPAERSKEDPEAKMTPARSPGEEKVGSLQLDVEPAEGSKENQEEKQASGNSRRAEDVGSPQLDTEPPGGESSSGTARKIRPRTLNEFVKLKPVEKFNKMMKSASSGEEVLEAGGRAMHARMLKTMAMNSDRRRFESASLNKFGSKLRSHMRNTRLEVSTGIVQSSKGDSGYRTRSSFSETLSCKSNLRKYSRRSDQDTERKSSIESTQAASLERIEEVETAAENSGSSDSGISPKTGTHRQKHEHDPKRLAEQRFEMTVFGLWATQSRREQLQLWMENAQFDVLPTDLDSELVDESAKRLSTLVLDKNTEHELIDECAKSLSTLVMSEGYFISTEPPGKLQSELSIAEDLEGDFMQSENKPESDGFSYDMLEDERKSEGLSSIEDVVCDLVEELLWQLEKKETSSSALTVSKRESAKDYVWLLTAVLGQTCKSKAFKISKITPSGGSMWLYGYEIIFPPGAVEEVTYIRISLDNNPQNFPKHGITISSILECHPSKFKVPVLVRLPTWLSAKPGKKIWVTIMSKPDATASWKEVQTVALGETNVVEYKTLCFCGHAAVVPSETINNGRLHLTNDVWIHNTTAYITSMFFKDDKTLMEVTKRLELELDHSRAISVPGNLTVSIGNTIAVEVECQKPPPPAMKISSIDETDGKLEINQEMLEKNICALVFEPEPHPEEMENVKRYRVLHRAKLLDSEGQPIPKKITIPLNFYWPRTSSNILGKRGAPQTSESNSHHISGSHFGAQGNMYFGGHDNYMDHSKRQDEATPSKRPMVKNEKDRA